jgi:nucleotide-binding universal stress UspA family protein
MLSLAKILVPIDFSEHSPGAARYAGRLARPYHSELTLLHVLDSSIHDLSAHEFTDPAIQGLVGGWRSRVKSLLTDFLHEEFLDVDSRRILLSGDPADVIVHFARFEHTSLIVLPTYAYEPFRRFVLGSVASKVLHDADCPVLTGVHTLDAFPQELPDFRKILCAVDFCPQSLKALEWASQLAEDFHAQLTVAHITPSTRHGIADYFNPERSQNWAAEIRHEEFATQARRNIEQMQKSVGASAAVLIDSGMDVPQAVCSAASHLGADLVVVGRGSSAGIDRLRTKVYSIVRQSPCPVLGV